MTSQPVDIQFPIRNGQMRFTLSRRITKREFETIKKVIDLMEDSIIEPETQNGMRFRECSNQVHKAYPVHLKKYPMRELLDYAKSIGVPTARTKSDLIINLVASGKATICGSLGN